MAKAAKTLPPQDPLTAGRRALHKRRNAAQDRRDALGLLGRVVVLAAAAWVLFTQVFLLTQASGNSMFPAVKDGDLLIGYRLQGTYAKNDVVLYEQDGKLRVGRVLGRENDLIALDDSGTLIVNGSERRDPLPHLRERHPRVPLHRPRGQRLHLGRLPHAIRGQPGFWPGGPHRRQSKGDHPAAAAELVSY